MRATLATFILLALVAPVLAAEPACEAERIGVEDPNPAPGVHAAAYVEARDCPGARSYEVALTDVEGRTSASWYDDERGRGVEAFRAPRFVSWTQSEARGCELIVYVFGAEEIGCVAGAPPQPPILP